MYGIGISKENLIPRRKDLVPLPADFIWVDELWVESTLPSALGVLFDKDHI